MAQTRLGKILEQEYKSNGLISGTTSALGKRALEKMDIRNSLFGGTGLGSILGRKIFGKGYSATRGVNSGISSASQDLSSSSNTQLDELNANARITAKNTLALPSMARDMHLIKKNIMQLVKLQGGTPTTKAGDWFSRQSAREAAFESKFGGKNAPVQVTGNNKEVKGGTGSLLLSLFGGLSSALMPLISVAGMVATAMAGMGKVIFKILGRIVGSKLGKLLGLTAATVGLASYLGGDEEGDTQTKLSQDNKKGFWDTAGDVAGNSVGAYMDYQGIKAGRALGSKVPKFTMTDKGVLKNSENKLVSAKKLGGGGKLADVAEKIRVFAVKAGKKGWGPRITQKLTARLGKWVAFKAATMFASFAAAPFTAGFSFLITIVSTLMLIKDLYDIYDAIFGENGIEKQLEDEDSGEKNTSPSLFSSDVDSNLNTSNGPVSLPSGQNSDLTFNSLSKEEQDKFLLNQAKAEGSLKPGTVGNRHNNPGNIIAKSPTEVYPAQAKFGGVPGETITGPDGKTRTFVRFPSWEDGFNAQRDLWTRKYGDMPIQQAMNKWVDPSSTNEMNNYSSVALNGLNKKSTNAGYEALANADIAGGAVLSSYSRDVASGYRSSGGTNVVNVNNSKNVNGGQGGNIQLSAADVMDSELGKLLINRAI